MRFGGGYQFRRICYPPAWSMRIYYPTNNEEPTPALPKGGSLNEAQYSLTTNRLTSNGHFSPLPLGGPGVGSHSPLPWRLLRRLLRIKNPDIQLRRITYPPELLLAPNRRYPPSLGEGRGWVLVTPRRGIDMSAPGNARGIGCRMDTPPKGAKE